MVRFSDSTFFIGPCSYRHLGDQQSQAYLDNHVLSSARNRLTYSTNRAVPESLVPGSVQSQSNTPCEHPTQCKHNLEWGKVGGLTTFKDSRMSNDPGLPMNARPGSGSVIFMPR